MVSNMVQDGTSLSKIYSLGTARWPNIASRPAEIAPRLPKMAPRGKASRLQPLERQVNEGCLNQRTDTNGRVDGNQLKPIEAHGNEWKRTETNGKRKLSLRERNRGTGNGFSYNPMSPKGGSSASIVSMKMVSVVIACLLA